MPAKAGIQKYLKKLDFRFRGNDAQGRFKTFYEFIKIEYRISNKECRSKKFYSIFQYFDIHYSLFGVLRFNPASSGLKLRALTKNE